MSFIADAHIRLAFKFFFICRIRFQLRQEEHIEFNKFGLRDNVAQICVLEV